MTQDFKEKLLLTIVDKLVLAVLLLYAGYWLNGRLQAFGSDLTNQREVAQERRALLSRQLSEFYWPLYLRLQKDTDVWNVFPDAHQGFGSALDEKVLRPNRQEIAKLIEEKVYLAHADAKLLGSLQNLLRHIAISETLRAKESKDDPAQLDAKYGWPPDVLPAVAQATMAVQREYDSLAR